MNLERSSIGIVGRPALVLVDMINGFTSSACPLGTDCPDVVAANAVLLKAFRERGLPVVFTTVVYHNDQQAKVFRSRIPALNCLTPDSNWVQIDPALAPIENERIFEKQWASSFFGTELHEHLSQLGVSSLVVTGLTTSGCVRATVIDGLQHDYAVVVAEEAVGDRNNDAHAANLFDMHAKYADVMKIDDVLRQLP
ncbi:Maleamate amidohydrolase [Zhongshania aliphaticivorans]|uniref:Maleamate amidohydrolase n=1 Tax=Zhongshania aliphaticivorans TaxID=1470434 RepID=A0A5S9MZN2_9GAMM|nr:isochorismatase family protein [Zhongshania aliphaticivorans]CAA0081906.1 Maleamate amidohydrolase [Zhongshania aliphaticivorans]CAA0084588.1 Maleamate amidohydrolase [Zhongshania aliphaticivorans]